MQFMRKQVRFATIREEEGRKPYLIISNNARNKNFDSVLAVRITTTLKHKHHRSNYLLPLSEQGCIKGVVLGDTIIEIWKDEFDQQEPTCYITERSMKHVEESLKVALGME